MQLVTDSDSIAVVTASLCLWGELRPCLHSPGLQLCPEHCQVWTWEEWKSSIPGSRGPQPSGKVSASVGKSSVWAQRQRGAASTWAESARTPELPTSFYLETPGGFPWVTPAQGLYCYSFFKSWMTGGGPLCASRSRRADLLGATGPDHPALQP